MTKYIPIEPQVEESPQRGIFWWTSPLGIDYGFSSPAEAPRALLQACPEPNCIGVVQRDGVWCWEVEERE